jgi:protein-S-isoprenylcysteine O-methyltransferase Ste14
MPRLLPPIYFIIALALMLALHLLVPGAAILAFPWRLSGLLPIAAGLTLNLVGAASFARHHTTINPFGRSTVIVDGGVFGLSRNPMYLGMALGLAGFALLFGSATPWLVVPAFVLLIERLFILPEERKLSEAFGQPYEDYRKRVRRWL